MTGVFGSKTIFTENRDEWYEGFTGAVLRMEVVEPAKKNKQSIGSNAPNALFYQTRAERGDVETRRVQGKHGRIRKTFQQAVGGIACVVFWSKYVLDTPFRGGVLLLSASTRQSTRQSGEGWRFRATAG